MTDYTTTTPGQSLGLPLPATTMHSPHSLFQSAWASLVSLVTDAAKSIPSSAGYNWLAWKSTQIESRVAAHIANKTELAPLAFWATRMGLESDVYATDYYYALKNRTHEEELDYALAAIAKLIGIVFQICFAAVWALSMACNAALEKHWPTIRATATNVYENATQAISGAIQGVLDSNAMRAYISTVIIAEYSLVRWLADRTSWYWLITNAEHLETELEGYLPLRMS